MLKAFRNWIFINKYNWDEVFSVKQRRLKSIKRFGRIKGANGRCTFIWKNNEKVFAFGCEKKLDHLQKQLKNGKTFTASRSATKAYEKLLKQMCMSKL